MPADKDPAGAGADPVQDVHQAQTVAHARDADFDSKEPPENARPASTGIADSAEFSHALVEIGLISAAELETFAADSFLSVLGLSRALVKAGKLTPYQAAAVYQRKSRGLLIGNYLILDKLGQGGMGVVFKARHRRLGRVGALKILPPSFARDRDAVLRFRREVEAAGRLKHPNLVAGQDADEDRGVHFLVMDYVEGSDLDRIVRERGPMPVAQAIDCLIQAARGLEAAHALGIIHRDIKPGNLMLDHAGTIRVLDLGLARIIDASNPFSKSAAGRLTQSGMYMGTVDYMAPEQAEDSHRVDHRADIYSLGCTLYYLLTGREPFPGETVLKRMIAHMERHAPSLRLARSDVPAALDEAYLKMMAKRPEERPASMTEVVSLLQACKAAAAESPTSRPDLKVSSEAPLKRAGAPKTRADPTIFARPKEAEGLAIGEELSLEDLVVDVRPEAPVAPLRPAPRPALARTQPLKRKSSTQSRSRLSRAGLAFLALAAAGVLGVVLVRFAMVREPVRILAPPREVTELKEKGTDLKKKVTSPPPQARVAGRAPQPAADPSFFDGKTLTGWGGLNEYWSVRDGAIVGLCPRGRPAHTFLCSTRSYSDFELRFQVKVRDGVGNSGVQFRSRITDRGNFRTSGPQCEIAELNNLHPPGSLVTEPGGPSLTAPRERVVGVYKAGDFNEFSIKCVGQHVTIRVNGVTTVDDDWPTMPREGIIAWQIHGTNPPREVVFKNITLVDLTSR
jgi:serine/threonine protein kinase